MAETRWTRPETVAFPRTWRRFEGKRPMADGRIPKFRIQDVTEDLTEAVLDHMCTHFLRDETICKAAEVLKDPVSVQEMRDIWTHFIKFRVAIVTLVDDGSSEPKIAGANILGLSFKGDPDIDQLKGEALSKIIGLVNVCTHLEDVFERYGVDKYMTAFGLSVDPEFRGQGLGLEMLKCRVDVGQAVGLKVTATVFTAIESQTLAARAGFELLGEVLYEDYKVDGETIFKNDKTKTSKLMAMRLD